MPSGLPNKEKSRIRQLYAEGKIGRKKLLTSESKSYHSRDLYFLRAANSNQMLMKLWVSIYRVVRSSILILASR